MHKQYCSSVITITDKFISVNHLQTHKCGLLLLLPTKGNSGRILGINGNNREQVYEEKNPKGKRKMKHIDLVDPILEIMLLYVQLNRQ